MASSVGGPCHGGAARLPFDHALYASTAFPRPPQMTSTSGAQHPVAKAGRRCRHSHRRTPSTTSGMSWTAGRPSGLDFGSRLPSFGSRHRALVPTCRRNARRQGKLKVVGLAGFEPATYWSQTSRATKLRYSPAGGEASRGRDAREAPRTTTHATHHAPHAPRSPRAPRTQRPFPSFFSTAFSFPGSAGTTGAAGATFSTNRSVGRNRAANQSRIIDRKCARCLPTRPCFCPG